MQWLVQAFQYDQSNARHWSMKLKRISHVLYWKQKTRKCAHCPGKSCESHLSLYYLIIHGKVPALKLVVTILNTRTAYSNYFFARVNLECSNSPHHCLLRQSATNLTAPRPGNPVRTKMPCALYLANPAVWPACTHQRQTAVRGVARLSVEPCLESPPRQEWGEASHLLLGLQQRWFPHCSLKTYIHSNDIGVNYFFIMWECVGMSTWA